MGFFKTKFRLIFPRSDAGFLFFMNINWDKVDKVVWSWPFMVLNALCFVFMICVFADGCRETKEIKDRKEAQRIINIIKATR